MNWSELILRSWMTRDVDALEDLPEIPWIEDKLEAIMTRLQNAKNPHMLIEKLAGTRVVDAQGRYFDMEKKA